MPPRPSNSSSRKPAISLPGSGSDPTGNRPPSACAREYGRDGAMRVGDYDARAGARPGRGRRRLPRALGGRARRGDQDVRLRARRRRDVSGPSRSRGSRGARRCGTRTSCGSSRPARKTARPYLVLEYVPGGSLADRLGEARCRSTRRSASWRRSRPASTRSIAPASSTGTSSRRTSCSARTARQRSRTSASRRAPRTRC